MGWGDFKKKVKGELSDFDDSVRSVASDADDWLRENPEFAATIPLMGVGGALIGSGMLSGSATGAVAAGSAGAGAGLSLIHISEPTRPCGTSRMPSSA